MVIRPTDRVAAVLERDEKLIDVFAALSPTFERLRDPRMRRVMARLVTVSAAARMAGIDEQLLVDRLNEALGAGEDGDAERRRSAPIAEGSARQEEVGTALPPALAGVPTENIVDLDVREDLRQGREPFSRIMAAKAALLPGQVLRLRAVFEPVPLYHVLGKQGFAHWTEKLADDDWRVWFHRTDGHGQQEARDASAASGGSDQPGNTAAAAASEPGASYEGDVVVLDVRGLEPPEPLVRTLAALETLPAGSTLVQINVRVPQFLLPRLEEAGFTYEIREQPDVVRVFIRRKSEG